MQSPAGSEKLQQVRNLAANWGAFLLSSVAGLFLSPFVVRSLGSDGFGLWTIVGSLTSALGIFDLGLRSAVVRFLAREHAKGDHDAASRKAGSLQFLFCAAALVVVVVGGTVALLLPRVFNVTPELVAQGRIALALSVASLAISLVGSVPSGVLMAMERLDILGLADMAFEVLRIGLIVMALSQGGGIVALAGVGMSLAICRYVVVVRASRAVYPNLRTSPHPPNRSELASILDVSVFSTLIYTSATLASQAGTLIIGASLPLGIAAAYAIGATLPEYAAALNRPIAQTVHPRASRLDAAENVAALQQLILQTGKLSALILLPVVLAFVVRGRTFIGLWQGSNYSESSGSVLAVLAWGILFAGPRHVMQAAFIGAGRHRVLGAWYIGEAILRIVATVVLVKKFGITGPAWASLVPGVIMATIVFPELCRRQFSMSRLLLVRELWIRPVVSLLPFGVALMLFERFSSAHSFFVFFGQIAIAMPIAVIGALYFAVAPDERKLYVDPARARLRGLVNHCSAAFR